MPTILDRIIANKRREVEALGAAGPSLDEMRERAATLPPCPSMSRALLADPAGIIAEFKRRSPSKGEIHPLAMAGEVVAAYQRGGAAACSVLTDTPFFGGSPADLSVAASVASIPLLRKDFIISERQIVEARLIGASAVLLIAAALTGQEMERLTAAAHRLSLEVLAEVHSLEELQKLPGEADMVGVNNRNLATFHTDPELSLKVAEALPERVVKVAESGLTHMAQVHRLREAGYRGFLIGETFMRHPDPGVALRQFLDGTL